MDVATLGLRLDGSQLEAGARRAQTALQGVQRQGTRTERAVQNIGRQLAVMAGGVIAVHQLARALRESTRAAVEFEASMTRIITLVGVGEEQVAQWNTELRRMSVEVGRGPRELAEALFVVTSAGERGANALRIVEQAAKASAIGLGETKDVARAVTAAMQAYQNVSLDAEKATNILVQTVREGNLEASSLAGALGRVLGIASTAGVSFEELGANIATVTRVGVSAEEAVTGLRAVITAMAAPTTDTVAALAEFDLTAQQLRDSVREQGLAQTLVDLVARIGDNEEALSRIIPNVRALANVLNTAGAQAESYTAISRNFTAALTNTNEQFKIQAETAEQTFARFRAEVENLGISLGNTLLPALKLVADSFAGIVAVLKTGALVATVVGLAVAFNKLSVAMGVALAVGTPLSALLLPLAGVFLAVAGGVAGLIAAIKLYSDEQKIANEEAKIAAEVEQQLIGIRARRVEQAKREAQFLTVEEKMRLGVLLRTKEATQATADEIAELRRLANVRAEIAATGEDPFATGRPRSQAYNEAAQAIDAEIAAQQSLVRALGQTEAAQASARIEQERLAAIQEASIGLVGEELAAMTVKINKLAELKQAEVDYNEAVRQTMADIGRGEAEQERERAKVDAAVNAAQAAHDSIQAKKQEVEWLRREIEARQESTEAYKEFLIQRQVEQELQRWMEQHRDADDEQIEAFRRATEEAIRLNGQLDRMNDLGLSWSETMRTAIEQMQRDIGSFFKDVFADGLAAFEEFATRLRDLFTDLFSNVLAQKVNELFRKAYADIEKLTEEQKAERSMARWAVGAVAGGALIGGISQGDIFGSAASGAAMASVLPGIGTAAGAAVGALGGLAGALFGAGDAAREAAKQIRRVRESLEDTLTMAEREAFGTPYEQEVGRISDRVLGLFNQIKQWYEDAITAPGVGDAERRRLTEQYHDMLERLNAVEREWMRQLEEELVLRNQQAREDYEVRRLAAEGAVREADALRFAIEQQREYADAVKAGLDDTTLAALTEAQLAEARAREAEQARLLANAMDDLRVRYMRAAGQDEEADALAFALQQQREYADAVRNGADATLLARLAIVQKAEAEAFAAQQEIAAAEERLKAAEDQVTASEQAVDSLRSLLDTLRGFRAQTEGLTGSPVQQLNIARQQFEEIAAAARAGDEGAARQLPELGRRLLDLSRQYFASGAGYVGDVQNVQSVIDAVIGQFGDQLSVEEQALQTAIEQRDALQAILDQLKAAEEQRQQDVRERDPWVVQYFDRWAYAQERETEAADRRHEEVIDKHDQELDLLAAGFDELTVKMDRLTERVDAGATLTKRTLEALA